MKLSVIMPCYNAADTIAVQLDALVKQQWCHPWELIVVDNRSTDESMKIVRQYTTRLPHLRIVDAAARRSRPYALNVGLAAAVGDAVAICDADDEVAPGWVAAMGDALSQYDFVAGKMETEKLNPSWVYAALGNHPQRKGLQPCLYPPYLPHAGSGNLGIKRAIHESVGGFNEFLLYLQDTDYCFRVQIAGTKLHFVPDAILHLRYRTTLFGIYRQARNYAQYEVLLFKTYRPPHSRDLWRWRVHMERWIVVIERLPRLLCSREGRALLMWLLGRQVGKLKGGLMYGVPPVRD